MFLYKRYCQRCLYIACTLLAIFSSCKRATHNSTGYIAKQPVVAPAARKKLLERLNVQYLKHNSYSQAFAHLAKLTPEDYSGYKGNESYHDGLTAKYGVQIAQGYIVPISIRWISKEVGYGIFYEGSKVLQAGDFLMEYTGEVCKNVSDSSYTWSYPPGNGNKLKGQQYSLDSKRRGNEARLVNHSDDPNVTTSFVFHDGSWHILYVVAAGKTIEKGQQLLVNYGTGYWASRNKVPLQ